eukprot:CAMPEP_0203858586 /NCGR_PEP_ID=MMETSP0359-20131031/11356_1 /ASSEMBLY_ACC=CAM_ASM_000338 /TAXON_ID=268821 /ORGANISM="Scrippsiella Hangoei, Strain SHTV-5" /LENGTH=74 /DNA_ID=CAMNT_0050775377 /DNA_START=8 /DNA_END=232 /DNA_ORIENTATION=-
MSQAHILASWHLHASGNSAERLPGSVPHRLSAGMVMSMGPQWTIHASGGCAERQAQIMPHRLSAVMLVRMKPPQ